MNVTIRIKKNSENFKVFFCFGVCIFEVKQNHKSCAV